MHKMLKGGTARTADPKWIKGYSRPYVILTNKTEGKVCHGDAVQEYLHISQLVVRICFHLDRLFLFGFIYLLFLLFITIYSYKYYYCCGGDDFFFILIFKQFLSQAMNFLTFTFPVLLPPSHCKKSVWVPMWHLFVG